MQQALTNILVKVFARGFYKVHSGLLIFLFVILIGYCFFINTAGDVKLLAPGKETYFHFIILLNFVSSPGLMILFFIAWLIYTIKSWYYVSAQLSIADNQFLYYSSTASGRAKQFKSWFYMQLIISLPFVCYALLASVIGLFFQHYIMITCILLFALLLIAISALLYVKLINNLVKNKGRGWVLVISAYWRKPYFSLFIYYMFDKLKITYLLSKFLSYVIIIGVVFSFADVRTDIRVAALTVLGIVMAHAILIYQQHKFELTYLGISRNLPYGIGRIYRQHVLTYLLLLLPEGIWLFADFNPLKAAGLLILALSIIMLFHCLFYYIGLAMNKYLPWIFVLFFALSLTILFGLMWLLIPVCLVASFSVFYLNYYKAELSLS
ncbi:hypothetical protein [Mucilaginibacter sp.]|uniref:hypothetical protein n=1 Tax=Mucilaginibacter sp. TaxID=1882438 RepID=UPI003D14FBB2